MSNASNNNFDSIKSNENNSNLFENESSKTEEGIQINYSNFSEKEEKEEQFNNTSNLSTPSYQSYFIGDENSKESCELADLLCLKNLYILCKECNENYSFKFQNMKYITIKCGCRIIRNCLISNFISKYCSKKPNDYGCIYHFGEKTDKYCKDCKIDLCKFCMDEKSVFDNDSGQHTRHETHTLIDLLNVKKEIEEIKNNLLKDEKLSNNENIKNLLENLITEYDNFPSYNSYKTIKKLLKKLPFSEPKNEVLNIETLYIIKSLEKLKESIDEPNSIYKILINGEKSNEIMEDLSIFQNKEFSNLKVLNLNNLKLKDISSLSSCSFPNLQKLDLECNEITNSSIKTLKALDLPKITYFCLFDNKITSTEIFGVIEKYQTLNAFFIGKNTFDKNIIKNDINKYIFPPNLWVLGISSNFTKETNNFIFKNLNLENLKVLYIYGNGFNSLEQFEQVKFNKLEEFWLRGNINKGYITDIKEIKYLNEKKNIKKIVLKENQIKNIEELIDIIPSFPNLQFLNLEDNPIDRDKIEEILGKIKKMKGFENFVIKYNQIKSVKKIYFING